MEYQSSVQEIVAAFSKDNIIKVSEDKINVFLKGITDASRNIVGASIIKPLCQTFVDLYSLQMNENYEELLNKSVWILRILRNLCVNSPENQDLIRSNSSFMTLLFDKTSAFAKVQSTHKDALQFLKPSIQFMANFITSNEENQNFVWKECFPSLLCELLDTSDRNLLMSLCVLIHNITVKSPSKRKEMAENEQLLRLVLRGAMINGVAAEDAAFEWIFFIVTAS